MPPFTEIQVLARRIGPALMGQHSGLMPYLVLPFVLKVGAQMTPVGSATALAGLLGIKSRLLADQGVCQVSVRVSAIELPQKGRFRLWLHTDWDGQAPIRRGADRMILYCSLRESRPAIEMVEWLSRCPVQEQVATVLRSA